jgi:glycosyltransferase involved in cell wall biosynthesis
MKSLLRGSLLSQVARDVVSLSTSNVEKRAPELSVVVPVFNGASTLQACLQALLCASGPSREIIVVDDASEDSSAEIATHLGVRTINHDLNLGCAAARNQGAKEARSQILVFVDCDVVVYPDALDRIYCFLLENKEFSAVFGSYDASPAAPHFVSQYRNLLHHFTHQNGNFEAKTFWTGLGAVRRAAFEQVGGFRGEYRPIEDIALGFDFIDAGYRIALDRRILGTHLKRWTLSSIVKTDIFDRALPWSTMVLKRRQFTNDLNTTVSHRLSVVSAFLGITTAMLSVKMPLFLWAFGMALCAFVASNVRIITFFVSERGLLFGIGIIPLHFIHHLCAGTGFGLAVLRYIKTWLIAPHNNLRGSTVYGLGPHER